MQANMSEVKEPIITETDEELIDVLTAISVVAKRLARKLREQTTEKGDNANEQNE